jgi:hypothetical protein
MSRSTSARVQATNMKNPLLQAGVALAGNASVGVKVVSATVLLSYCLSYSESAVLALSVTPGYFWPPHFWLWTAFTHCFLEIHWWEVVVDVVTVVLVCIFLKYFF